MAKIIWDATGTRYYNYGVDRGVMYPFSEAKYQKGVAWSGLINVTQSPDGAEANDFYGDNVKYGSIRSVEKFKGSISVYSYPPEFAVCNGEATLVPGVTIGQQGREPFGFSYRTMIGDDTSSDPKNYYIHLVYGATVSPTEESYDTINDSPSPMTMEYSFDTTPVPVTGYKPTAHLMIDSRTVTPEKLKEIEDTLYGTDSEPAIEPKLLLPDELKAILAA
jgi:hypothetical protein